MRLPRIRGDRPGKNKFISGLTWATRIRGDRPWLRGHEKTIEWATPHTRGSTPASGGLLHRGGGYPAYAGIDLFTLTAQDRHGGLPRIRGDRPLMVKSRPDNVLATPHTRGSTLSRILYIVRLLGYPAYAGIDPRSLPMADPGVGLPRIRGDRPRPWLLLPRQLSATPHTRGSTAFARPIRIEHFGYPAYAGIDLTHNTINEPWFWLPRIRGDRPPGARPKMDV